MRRVREVLFLSKLPSAVPKLVDPLDCLMLLSADLVTDDTLPHSRQLTPGPLPARRCSKEQLSRAFLRSTKLIFLSDLWVPIQLFRPSMHLLVFGGESGSVLDVELSGLRYRVAVWVKILTFRAEVEAQC